MPTVQYWYGAHRVLFQTIIKNLPAIQSSGLRLVAVADAQKSVSRYKCSKGSGIKILDDHRDLLTIDGLDMILECTGDERVLFDIISRKPPNVGVLDEKRLPCG